MAIEGTELMTPARRGVNTDFLSEHYLCSSETLPPFISHIHLQDVAGRISVKSQYLCREVHLFSPFLGQSDGKVVGAPWAGDEVKMVQVS